MWTYKGHSISWSMMGRDAWQGLEREPLLWMGGYYQEALRHQHHLAQGAGIKSEPYLRALKECSGNRAFQSKGQGS